MRKSEPKRFMRRDTSARDRARTAGAYAERDRARQLEPKPALVKEIAAVLEIK
jgi:hypothetical protein